MTLVANSGQASPSRSLGGLGPPAKGSPRASDCPAEFATSVNVGIGRTSAALETCLRDLGTSLPAGEATRAAAYVYAEAAS